MSLSALMCLTDVFLIVFRRQWRCMAQRSKFEKEKCVSGTDSLFGLGLLNGIVDNKKNIQHHQNYPLSMTEQRVEPRPQSAWRKNKLLKGKKSTFRYLSLPGDRGPRGSDIGQKSFSSHLWPSELCALQRETQREQHRWFYTCSCPAFFNTCTLCLCHPVLLSDINLWHTDNQVWVSTYRATVNIQEVVLAFSTKSPSLTGFDEKKNSTQCLL